MSRNGLMLAMVALAVILLAGCKQPVGLPSNDVHVATTYTTYCTVSDVVQPTGFASHFVDGNTPDGWYTRTGDSIIQRRLHVVDGYDYPRTYGYCHFNVPHFEPSGSVPACTLFYRQKYHRGSLNLIFNQVLPPSWLPDAESLWKKIDANTYQLAPTQSSQSDGWCQLALSNAGASIIAGIGANANGGSLITGWKFTGGSSDDSTGVYGTRDVDIAPYIKVVYDAP